jgi:hypothetical protein
LLAQLYGRVVILLLTQLYGRVGILLLTQLYVTVDGKTNCMTASFP